MSIKMRVHDGESLPLALRRFRRLVSQVSSYRLRHSWLSAKRTRIHRKKSERIKYKQYLKRRGKARTRFLRIKKASLKGPIWYFYL